MLIFSLLLFLIFQIEASTETSKSIWLIRPTEKYLKKKAHMAKFPEDQCNWGLSLKGGTQAKRIGDVLKERYENLKPPHIFVSPSRSTVQTGLAITMKLTDSKIKIEDGLLAKRIGQLKNKASMLDRITEYFNCFDKGYKSKFQLEETLTNPNTLTDINIKEVNQKEFLFDEQVAKYFLKLFLDKSDEHDIVLIADKVELYNLQKVFTGKKLFSHDEKEFEKIGIGCMFEYIVDPDAPKLKLNSVYTILKN